jgi:hypothetical protein
MEADRQLRLGDLLSTAWSVRGDAGEPWRQTVANLADAACRAARPSEVLLRRWGARAWGAISLSTALLLVVAVLVERPSEGLASLRKSRGEEGAIVIPPANPESGPMTDAGHGVVPRGMAHREPEEPGLDAGNALATDAKAERDAAGQPSQGPPSANASAQAGGGFAQTKTPTQSLQLGSHGGARQERDKGATAVGGNLAGRPPHPGAGNPTGGEAGDTPGGRVSGHDATDWGVGEAGGWKVVEGRPEYQPYRELIQAYFERP